MAKRLPSRRLDTVLSRARDIFLLTWALPTAALFYDACHYCLYPPRIVARTLTSQASRLL